MSEKRGHSRTADMIFTALFAAIVAVMSQISVPAPSGVPVTLQTFAVSLCGYCLGTKRGTAAIAVYILTGAVGVPVFTGMKGGFVCLVSVTGGFIWGFLALAAMCGLRVRKKPLRMAAGIAGLLICHLCGTLQYALVMGISPVQSFLTVSVPYLVKDIISTAGAFAAADALIKAKAFIS